MKTESDRTTPPDLYRKLVLLTGIRLLVGTALLIATAALSGGSSGFLGGIEAHLYAIVGALYVASLVSMVLLRRRRFLRGLVLAHVVAAVLGAIAASVAFCGLLVGTENGIIRPATRYVEHPPLPAQQVALTVALNLSAFFLAGAL